MDNDKKSSRDKILKDILSDFEDKDEKTEVKPERSISDSYGRKIKKILFYLWIGVTIVLIARLGVEVKPKNNIMWAQGIRKTSDYRINDCIANMWHLRRAADNFYGIKNIFPEKMSDMYGNYVDDTIVCPASGRKYEIKEYEGRKCFACPSPEEHGVNALFCRVVAGAPEIARTD